MLDIESRLTGTAVDGAQPGHSILLWQIIYNAMVRGCYHAARLKYGAASSKFHFIDFKLIKTTTTLPSSIARPTRLYT